MASLRNIMNVDDEGTNAPPSRDNREPLPRPVHPQAPPTVPSSYAAPPEMPVHQPQASSHSRGASPYSAYTHTPDSSSSHHQGAMSMSPERRRSIPSEHRDYPYPHGQAYGHASPYTNPAMRPMMAGDPGAEASVKLTPITGRVSRAKKGIPVHTCDVCRPPKTFTRAEHLRRHQLSHQPAKLVCSVPGCNKVFHRKDLLERHQQRHEHDEKLPPIGRQPPNTTQGGGGQSYGSTSQASMAPYRHMNNAGVSSNQPRHDGPVQGRWSPNGRSPGPGGHPLSSRMPDSSRDYYVRGMHGEHNVEARSHTRNSSSTAASVFGHSLPPTNAKNNNEPSQDLYMSDGDQSSRQWHDSPLNPSSSAGSTYSTPSDTSQDHDARPRSSSQDWSRRAANPTMVPGANASPSLSRAVAPMFGYSLSPSPPQAAFSTPGTRMPFPLPGYEDDPLTHDQHLFPHPARNLALPFAAGRSSETLVAAPPTLPAQRTVPPASLAAVSSTGMDAFLNPVLPSTALSECTRDAIPIYIEVYWNKVHPMYPIIHRQTFEAACKPFSDSMEILQCTMAAVATQYLGHEDHRISGNQLHLNSVHKLRMTSYDNDWSLETMQAVLLCEYYSRFRGRDKNAYQSSPLFAFLYQKAVTCQITSELPATTSASEYERWQRWVEVETRRRLLAACFLLDVHCMRYFEQAPVSAVGLDYSAPRSLPIPLTSNSGELWDATSCAAWSRLYDPESVHLTIKDAVSHGLTSADIEQASPFDASVLLAAYALQFKRRQSPTGIDLVQDASTIEITEIDVANLFAHSAVGNTYLALHQTQLHVILSVSGDSWVFNKKVLRQASFVQQQGQLARWRDSGSAAVAAAFAARALVAFLRLDSDSDGSGTTETKAPTSPNNLSCADISDYWGIYVCALICWAFGHVGRDAAQHARSSRSATVQWLLSAAKLQPSHVQRLAGRRHAQGVVSLAREALEKEHFGGRSILIADAVGVLRKLEDGDACKRF